MKQIPASNQLREEYLPVMLVRRNLTRFARDKGLELIEDTDEFDAFTMARIELDHECEFLLLHYAGADENTFDIWLPTDIGNPSKCLLDVISALELDSKDVVLRQLSANAFPERMRA